MMDNTKPPNKNNWTYQRAVVEELPEWCIGFVYLITNTQSGRMYIGKKLATTAKTKIKTVTLKSGIKRKKKEKSRVASKWADYYGSSKELLEEIKANGKDLYTREILHLCKSKAECSYLEAKEQFARGVLESDTYYNNNIMIRVHGTHIFNKL